MYKKTLPSFAYVKKKTYLEVYELGFVFYKLWSLDSPGNFYATIKTERKPKYIDKKYLIW